MNMAFGQKRLARGASPGALPQATVSGGLRPNSISGASALKRAAAEAAVVSEIDRANRALATAPCDARPRRTLLYSGFILAFSLKPLDLIEWVVKIQQSHSSRFAPPRITRLVQITLVP